MEVTALEAIADATARSSETESAGGMNVKLLKGFLGATLVIASLFGAGCTGVTTSVSTGGLGTEDLHFATKENGPEVSDKRFKKGEVVWMEFKITGFKQADDDNVWVQEDLDVIGPDGKSILKKENLLDFHEKAPKGAGNVSASNNITLPKDSAPGAYNVKISLRDKVGGGSATVNTGFEVIDAGGSPAPEGAAPAPK